jgi:hypothetical protein
MVDYLPLRSNNWKQAEAEPEPKEEQAVLAPVIDVVVNTYHEKGDCKSFALKLSIRLPLNS